MEMTGVQTNFRPSRWSRARTLALVGWLFVPLLVAAYHYGPGQTRLQFDAAGTAIGKARAAVAAKKWRTAILAYEDALAALPADQVQTARRLRLEKCKAQMNVSKLPQAHGDLKGLLDEMVADQAAVTPADVALKREVRTALANSSYYMTWLMRLEGVARAEWEPEIEASRQHFALLEADASTGAEKSRYQKDLASAIRLARMDLSELQGLPLPSQ